MRTLVVGVVAAMAIGSAPPPVAADGAPPNDNFVDAVTLTSADLPYTPGAIDTTAATTEPDEPDHTCGGGSVRANTIWVRYTTDTPGAIQVNTQGSDYDTTIAVWSGASIGALAYVTCAHVDGGLGVVAAFHANAAVTYWIQVGGNTADSATQPFGSLALAIRAQDPANDFAADAVELTNADLPYTPAAIDTTFATTENGEPSHTCGGGSTRADTVWYRYTTDTPGAVLVDTEGSNFDTTIAVWTGASIGSLSYVTCAHTDGDLGVFTAFHATTGLTYWIQVGGNAADSVTDPFGTLHLAIRAQDPANDFFTDAVTLTDTDLPYTPAAVDTRSATTETNEPSHSCGGGSTRANTVWYRYTTASAGAIGVSTEGSAYDTTIAVWTGSAISALTYVTCAHADGVHGQSVTVSTSPGTTYWIQVGGNASDGVTEPFGSLQLAITDGCGPTAVAPGVTLAGGTYDGPVPATLAWSATPHCGAAITGYELQQRVDGGTWSDLGSPVAPTATVGMDPGKAYEFRVRALDNAARTSAWAKGAVLAPAAYQEGSSKVTWSGKWKSRAGASFSGGAARSSSVAGARATFTFTGRAVSWVSHRCTGCGKARIYVDGVKVKTVDLGGGTAYRLIAWSRTWSSASKHTVRIVVVGTSGRPRVDVDAFLALS